MTTPVDEEHAGTTPPAEQALSPAGDHSAGQADETEARPDQAEAPVQVPDRYDLRRCRLHFSITMLEDDNDLSGRRVILGVRNDEDDPITRMIRATGPEALFAELIGLQAQLEADLPRRLEKTRKANQQASKSAQKHTKPAPPASSPLPSSTPAGVDSNQETAPIAAAPAPKPATAARRGAKGQEDSSFEQMSLFGA